MDHSENHQAPKRHIVHPGRRIPFGVAVALLALVGCSDPVDPPSRPPGDRTVQRANVCGDGAIDPGEECDLGGANDDAGEFCTTACQVPTCADGLANGGESDIDCGVVCGDESCDFRQTCDGPNTCFDPELEVVCDLTHRSCARPEAVDLVAGEEHTCALFNGGGVRCWGSNEFGQLGYPGVDHVGLADEPWEVGDIPLGGSAVQISAGRHHTCAVLTDGAVRCWGRGAGGRLGYGNEDDVGRELEPAAAGDVILGGEALEVHAGSDFTCAMMEDGNPRCWGENGFGQLGRPHAGSIGDDETPGSVGPIGFGSPVVALAVGYVHACAVTADDDIFCWGRAYQGQLGLALGVSTTEDIGDDETAYSAGPVDVGFTPGHVVAGIHHTCVSSAETPEGVGNVRCWGYGPDGQTGLGSAHNIGDDETPAEAGGYALTIAPPNMPSHLTSGSSARHSCAMNDYFDGSIACWGKGNDYQLGTSDDEHMGNDEAPFWVNTGHSLIDLATGGFHSCALTEWGGVFCWGRGSHGQLGYGNAETVGDDEGSFEGGWVHVTDPSVPN